MKRAPFLIGLAVAILAPLSSVAQYDRRTAIVEAVKKTQGSIVNLRTLRVIPARFDDDSTGRVKGLGTGVLVDPRGYIITNYHVVEKVDEIEALTADGRDYRARVVNSDERADLAVLKIEGRDDFPFLPLGAAGEALVGETVIVIGNPYGLENSVTTGIVSAVNRELKLPNGEIFDDLIQTDASINPGNSGGPLVSINGDLLGINVAIRSNAQGIGFAIPTRKVQQIVREMMGSPRLSIAQHGLLIEESAQPTSASSGDDSQVTSPIIRVGRVEPDSPAQKVGFQPGDEVVSVAGQHIKVPFDLDRILWGRKYGESLSITVRGSNGQTRSLVLTFSPPTDDEVLWDRFGIRVRKVDAAAVRPVYDKLNGGLLLTDVAPGSAAAQAGLHPGDILLGLHNWETIEPNNVRYVMQWKDLAQNQPVEFHYIRGGVMSKGRLHLPAIR